MDSSKEEMGICRDTLLALLEFLVDPLLPSRSTLRESISLLQQESVAKQVHAVVLLYNYYHRKQHPGLAFLEFGSFCELALDLKPTLHLYFKVAQKTDISDMDELDKDLSLTEKAIMSACDTSKSLDASKNDPNIDGWSISKVAVFLVDNGKENCVLFHSSTTQGVWSVIEKEVSVENQGSEELEEGKIGNEKKGIVKRMDETSLRELAYLAVKEACGINLADLKILCNHSVHSTSKAKTTVRLFIMKCTQTIQNMNLVPINDVMDSLQGSLVENKSVTPVVEYFHLLSFADKVLDCLKSNKENSQDSSKDIEPTKDDGNHINSISTIKQSPDPSFLIEPLRSTSNIPPLEEELLPSISEQNRTILDEKFESEMRVKSGSICRKKDHPTETLVYKKRNKSKMNNTDNNISSTNTSNALGNYPRQELEQCEVTGSSESMNINGKRSFNICEDVRDSKLVISVQNTDPAALTEQAIDVAEYPGDVEKASSNYEINGTTISNDNGEQDGALVPFDSDFENLCKMEMTITSMDPSLSKTTLEILSRKILQLTQEHRKITDELALCEANMQTILRGGVDSLAVKIDTLVEGCNEIIQQTTSKVGEKTTLHYDYQDFSPTPKRKRLSESPCQELDGICRKNLWMLPSYVISPLKEGFKASVIMKGDDFKCSSEGPTCDTPLEARNSAASKLLEQLRSLAVKL